MVIRNLFELGAIKDQLGLIKMLTSHISFENYQDGLPDSALSDYKMLLDKIENATKNLTDKKNDLDNLLNN